MVIDFNLPKLNILRVGTLPFLSIFASQGPKTQHGLNQCWSFWDLVHSFIQVFAGDRIVAPHWCPHPSPWKPVTVLGYTAEGDREIMLDYLHCLDGEGGCRVRVQGEVMMEAEVRDMP